MIRVYMAPELIESVKSSPTNHRQRILRDKQDCNPRHRVVLIYFSNACTHPEHALLHMFYQHFKKSC